MSDISNADYVPAVDRKQLTQEAQEEGLPLLSGHNLVLNSLQYARRLTVFERQFLNIA